MHALTALERFNVRIADEANGDSNAYDKLLVANADEARRLIDEAKATCGDRLKSPGCYHYIDGIERRLNQATRGD